MSILHLFNEVQKSIFLLFKIFYIVNKILFFLYIWIFFVRQSVVPYLLLFAVILSWKYNIALLNVFRREK